uniref:C2H2-type domain-containing protein n=1 Tax=Leptobrachium leishanense TaxID=445787 RepID=A0A8C5Q5I6_9ANUR
MGIPTVLWPSMSTEIIWPQKCFSLVGFQCPGCNQEFQCKISFLSHTCFLYSKGKDGTNSRHLRRSTNFHNLARDMESADDEGCKSVLLEKTNCLEREFSPSRNEDGLIVSVVSNSRTVAKRLQKESAFSDFQKQKNLQDTEKDDGDPGVSAFSPVFAKRKIACRSSSQSLCDIFNSSTGTGVMDFHDKVSTHYEYFSLFHSLSNRSLAELWQKPDVITQPHPQQLLPPTITPLGVTAQNWCAKCRLSFSMTSDLVLHMRSRHKRETVVEAQRKRRRELHLSCPVCCACFRERHHLSRHMTSHC